MLCFALLNNGGINCYSIETSLIKNCNLKIQTLNVNFIFFNLCNLFQISLMNYTIAQILIKFMTKVYNAITAASVNEFFGTRSLLSLILRLHTKI